MKPGDIIALEERFTNTCGFKWTNWRLVKVLRTSVGTYLPYPGGLPRHPIKNHRIIPLDAWFQKRAQSYWNQSNHFNDFATFGQLVDAIGGRPIMKPSKTPPPTPEAI